MTQLSTARRKRPTEGVLVLLLIYERTVDTVDVVDGTFAQLGCSPLILREQHG